MDEMRLGTIDEPPAVTVAEAARRLGKSVDAIRSLARRDKLKARRGNDGRLLIVLPATNDVVAVTDEADDEAGETSAVLREQLEDMRDQLDHWRRTAEDARVGQARAEAEAAAQRELVGELKRLLEGAQRPWWRRLVG